MKLGNMEKATQKQLGYLEHLLKDTDIWKTIPRNNALYPNTKVDYRGCIFEDLFKNISKSTISSLIQGVLDESEKSFNYIKKVINNPMTNALTGLSYKDEQPEAFTNYPNPMPDDPDIRSWNSEADA